MNLWDLADLCTPWCLHVVATLRVADRLTDGPLDIRSLAAAVNADAGALERVLRHLAAKGVFEEASPGRFALNEAARELLDSSALLGLDLNGIGGRMAYAWGTLLGAVRTGKPAYHEAFGKPFWDDLAAHPEIAASFDDLMGPAGHGTPDPDLPGNSAARAGVRSVADIGGGTGALLAEILRIHPEIHGTLVDLPGTIGRSAETFERAGVMDRVTLCPQSFFDPLPPGRDVYLLKNVLADWPDAEAEALLERCAEAAHPSGRVFVLGGITDAETASPELLMLVLVGGKNRTLEEFGQLARRAGLEVCSSGKNRSGRLVVECVAKG